MLTDQGIEDALEGLRDVFPLAFRGREWDGIVRSTMRMARRRSFDDEMLTEAALLIQEEGKLTGNSNVTDEIRKACEKLLAGDVEGVKRELCPARRFESWGMCVGAISKKYDRLITKPHCDRGWLVLPLPTRETCIPCPYCSEGEAHRQKAGRDRILRAELTDRDQAEITEALQEFDAWLQEVGRVNRGVA